MFSTLAFVVLGLWAAWSIACLLSHRRQAMATGVPYVLSPVSTDNMLWNIISGIFKSARNIRLPFEMTTRYSVRGWSYIDQIDTHEKLGKIFMIVSPGEKELYIADAAVAQSVWKKPKEFLKPVAMLDPLRDHFGKSVATEDGADWQRHRKITATTFNERSNGLVWDEAVRQTGQMLEHWRQTSDSIVDSVAEGTSIVALHVLTACGLGMSYDFSSVNNEPKAGYKMTYAQSLSTVIGEVMLLMVVPKSVYSLPWLPAALDNFKTALHDLKSYMREQVAEAHQRVSENTVVAPNVLNALVKSNREETVSSAGLTDNEIHGNLFIFSFAGHETTAGSLAYTIYLFAAFPEIQEWVAEEVQHVMSKYDTLKSVPYAEIYPQLKRCLASMYETLRCYPPVLLVPKCTGAQPGTLKYEGKELVVPPHTTVWTNVMALNTTPEYWGADNLTWKPSRWIEKAETKSPALAEDDFEAETMWKPIPGAYLPWADGQRVCPGKKFSQVEFVGVIARLLWKHKISVVPLANETPLAAQERCLAVIKNSAAKLTLQMVDPTSVNLKFTER